MHSNEEMPTQISTIQDFISWGEKILEDAGLFYGHGTENALDEAAFLILHTLHLPCDLPSERFKDELTESEKKEVVEILERRISERKPASYLTNEAWFSGLSFYVDERVLVPRSPIAELIEENFSPWINSNRVERVLDLCTGSGCIAIATAYAFPEALVDAVDLSEDALQVARINIKRHAMEQRVVPVQSDLFSGLVGQQYDIIVSNPPYVSRDELKQLPPEYTHEPEFGLVSGIDGLDAVVKILQQASGFLKPDGILVVEVGNTESIMEERFPTLPFTWLEFERGGHGVFLLTKEQLKH